MQDFNSFSITFYYFFSTTYQKIGDLFCPVIFLKFRSVWGIDWMVEFFKEKQNRVEESRGNVFEFVSEYAIIKLFVLRLVFPPNTWQGSIAQVLWHPALSFQRAIFYYIN